MSGSRRFPKFTAKVAAAANLYGIPCVESIRMRTGPDSHQTLHPRPWASRTIPHGRAVEELPQLLERVRGTPARLHDLFLGRAPEVLHTRPSGKWSAVGHVAHLLIVQQLFHARVEDFLALRPQLCDIDLSGQESRIEQHEQRGFGDLLEEFRLERQLFIHTLTTAEPNVHRHVALHPCAQRPMRPVDMLLWIAEHDDHHLATIRGLLEG